VEAVTCLTPVSANAFTRVSGFSFTYGIIGSMRTATGMPSAISFAAAFRRSLGGGALGSRVLAVSKSSVVIVMATMEGTRLKRSVSLKTVVDLVIIWIRQFCLAKISRHRLVKPFSASMVGYGSEELAMEISSPLSLAASRFKRCNRSFLGRQL
jgi:hypothetical protein